MRSRARPRARATQRRGVFVEDTLATPAALHRRVTGEEMASFVVQVNGEEATLAVSGSGVRLGGEDFRFDEIYR